LANYRLYRLDGAGKITSAEWLAAKDDKHAADMAREIDSQTVVEVWDRDRLVIRISPGRPER